MPANYKRHVVDIATGTTRLVDMTPEERKAQDDAATYSAAEEQLLADKAEACRQLKAKAKTDQNLALLARAMGIDPAA